jgi:hypothetical protein
MALLGDVGQAKAHFDPFGYSFNPVQDRCTVCDQSTTAWKSLWTHRMVLLGNVCQVEACFGPFGYSVSLGAR